MKLLKKFGVSILTTTMLTVSAFGFSSNAYAATSCKKIIKPNVTYKYDIDGDGDKDTIKVFKSKDKVLLKVNKCVKTVIYDCGSNCSYNVKIYDLNKNDKSSEIIVYYSDDDSYCTRILKFKDNTCKLNVSYNDAQLSSYTSKNGIVTFTEYDCGRYNKFAKAIGDFGCYSKVKVNGYKLSNQYTANTISAVKDNKYIANQNLTAYTSTNSRQKAFTIKKNQPVHVYALYQNGNKRYIKVKNNAGKYGYVKIGASLIFTKDSCIWAR